MKIALIVLLVIIAAFVVLMIHGAKANDSGQASSGGTADAQNFNANDYPAVGWLGSALGKFSPKLSVTQIQPQVAQWNLQTQANYSLVIASDSKNKFRSAKFQVPVFNNRRCAHLVYKSAGDPPTGLDSLKEQDSENLGAADKKTAKTEVTFTILASGGQIAIARNSLFVQGCLVQLVN
jgi:hypothetical protein